MSDHVYLARGFWNVPEDWAGDTVVILGGGPSLAALLPRLAQGPFRRLGGVGRARTIAINDGYLAAPWAEMLYFCDARWHAWHKGRPEFAAFAGEIVTLDNLGLRAQDPRIRSVANMGPGDDAAAGNVGLFDRPWGIFHGRNGGYQAIHIAVHRGAQRILLVGYDMRPAADGRCNWHDGHPLPPSPAVYAQAMLPSFPHLARACAARGVEVVNCTPGSALDAFPRGELDDWVI